jgi:hypothetical protein
MKSLDEKLARIRAGNATRRDFILTDAKDADMAFGVTAPGPAGKCPPNSRREADGCWKSLPDYQRQIREVISQGVVDIVLLSASNLERLAMNERLFEQSRITPAARANDTTDIWVVRGGSYPAQPSRSFRTATLEHIKYGRTPAPTSVSTRLPSPTTSSGTTARWRSSRRSARKRRRSASATSSSSSTPTLTRVFRPARSAASSTTTSCARWRASRRPAGPSS